jgi:RHS repeat-associated protein
VTDTYTYDAFGNLINSTGSTANNYLFAGEQYDPDLGLYYNRARYLDVRVGRFWGMDTEEGGVTRPSSLHKYLYASANPVNRVDPNGHDDFSMASISVSEGIGEEIDGEEAEADFTAKRALSAHIIDIYKCSRWAWPPSFPYHMWAYANLPGNQGMRYDVGAYEFNATVLTGQTVPGGLVIQESSLASMQSQANGGISKEASLSFLRYLEWQAFVIGDAYFVDMTSDGLFEFAREYNLLPFGADSIKAAVNCIVFTQLAIAEAKKLDKED